MKNQIIVSPAGDDIVDVLAGLPRPKSDINLFRERQKRFAPRQKFNGNKAYKGESSISTQNKKPKKGELTLAHKKQTKELVDKRIFVEYLIYLVKIF